MQDCSPPAHRTDAGNEFPQSKWLYDIVVCAKFEAIDFVLFLAAGESIMISIRRLT